MILRCVLRPGSAALALTCLAGAAGATCVATVEDRRPLFVPAAYRLVETVAPRHVGITFLGHSSFEIQSPRGIRIVTDYNGYIRPPLLPHVVTMNRTHRSHYTLDPDPGIKFVLPGWDPDGGVAKHNIDIEDVRVRNVPTDVYPIGGGRLTNNNSIFIYEVSGLCVVHLGHLHHVLSEAQRAEIGRADVLMIPIDGRSTMSPEEQREVIKQLDPVLVLPMHFTNWWGSVPAFAELAKEIGYVVRQHDGYRIELAIGDLPRQRTVLFMPPGR